MLFPTQEHAAVISALQGAIPVRTVVSDFDSLRATIFIKQQVSTASSRVRRARSEAELREAARALDLGQQPLLAQEAAFAWR